MKEGPSYDLSDHRENYEARFGDPEPWDYSLIRKNEVLSLLTDLIDGRLSNRVVMQMCRVAGIDPNDTNRVEKLLETGMKALDKQECDGFN